jgi:multidrug efflux pump subunit AcrA (membrane-fusion protein)
VAELPDPEDPLAAELDRQRRGLAEAQAQLLEQMKQWDQAQQQAATLSGELTALAARRQGLEAERAAVEGARPPGPEPANDFRQVSLSLAEIQARGKKLTEEIDALRKLPSPKRTLRYRTPVSQPLQSEELMFECQQGRVSLVDVGALLEEVRRDLRDREQQLRRSWEVIDVTPPVGAFRLRYVIERERGLLEGANPNMPPDGQGNFRYGLSSWQVEPVVAVRGETLEEAFRPGSAFRRVADSLDPQQTAVTFWVYEDSFPLYRRLRDYLHEHDVVVAGRPLPRGASIASSRRGTTSRGQ